MLLRLFGRMNRSLGLNNIDGHNVGPGSLALSSSRVGISVSCKSIIEQEFPTKFRNDDDL